MWKDTDHFKNKGGKSSETLKFSTHASVLIFFSPCIVLIVVSYLMMLSFTDYRRYAVFCLLRIGTDIYETSMLNNVDRSMTDLTFDDIMVL